MSARNSSSRNAKVAPKPFCKVCHDAGKSEIEYTSHFVKSNPGPNGKVVCPTLLAQECRYCYNAGHTAGYCPVIAEKKKADERAEREVARREAAEKKPATKPATKQQTNVFAALNDSSTDSELEEKVSKFTNIKKNPTIIASKSSERKPSAVPTSKPTATKVVKEEFPALPSAKPKSTVANVPAMTGYASAAAKTQEEYENEKYEQQMIAASIKRQMPPLIKKTTFAAASAYYDEESDSDDSWAKEVVKKPQEKASLLDWTKKYDSDSDW